MKRLIALRNAFCAGNPLIGLRGLAVLAFLTVLGAFLARGFHQGSLSDFLGGMSIAFTAILVFQTFSLESAEKKPDPGENSLTELHLT